ncbi:hypothetical protein HBDW_26540 [Herbaspirillum sp. DW155]|uniref:hypothetical protein n=1 Tax=Herbaspirillum sp. DW155 TaxID=3095609 RepID=UPI00308B7957|nr:hypothetical protein HBDW_26540 [Herbaspirillum sp. DW155]
MSDKIPLPEDTTEATETGMDQRKPQPLPHDAVQGRSDPPGKHPRGGAEEEEHPLSVGKP